MADKTDHLSQDSVSRIKDLEIQEVNGSIYHGLRASFDSPHTATTPKISLVLVRVL